MISSPPFLSSSRLGDTVSIPGSQLGKLEKVAGQSSEDLLRQIFPSHVAEKLRSHKVIPPEHFSNVSVLFADVEAYTTIASRLTPLQTHTLLNDLYTSIDSLLSCFPCLYKVETIGDGELCAACCALSTVSSVLCVLCAHPHFPSLLQQ